MCVLTYTKVDFLGEDGGGLQDMTLQLRCIKAVSRDDFPFCTFCHILSE